MGTVVAMPRSSMSEKVAELRGLIKEVQLVSVSDLARRWTVTRQSAHDLMTREGAPAPVFESTSVKLWALPEAERYRSLRLQQAQGRGGRQTARRR